MTVPKVVIQHYVPQLYLQHFTFDKHQAQVRCYDKLSRKTFPTNIKNIASSRYFYDTKYDQNQAMESALGQIETKFNDSYLKLLSAGDIGALGDADREVIAFFIGVQEIRTQEFRHRQSDLIKQMTAAVLDRLSADATPEAKDRFVKSQQELLDEDKLKLLQIKTILEVAPKQAEILLDMKWVLLSNPTDLPFWTSDHPVVRHNPVKPSIYGNMGLTNTGIQVYFPLSSSLCLLIRDPVNYKDDTAKLTMTDRSNAIFVNQFQVRMSTRFLISKKTDFDLAEMMIAKEPQIANVDRKRWEVS